MTSAKFFDEKLKRIFIATETSSDSGLARVLGIQPPSVAAARKRQQIPGSWIEKVAEHFGVNANWLLFGTGQMKGESTQKPRFDEALLLQCIEILEEFLDLEKKVMVPKTKATVICRLYELVLENDVEERSEKPLQALRLIRGALAEAG